MAVDREAFEAARHPLNVLSLMDESVLVQLLNGFSYAIGAGVSIHYRTERTATAANLERKDALGDPMTARRFYHPFCRTYRECAEGDQQCRQYDRTVALRYFAGEWTRQTLYRCHMQLWDMAYPLRVGREILGVLLAGQMVLTSSEEETRKGLANAGIHVCWDSIPGQAYPQVDVIASASPADLRDRLEPILRKDPEAKNIDVKLLVERWQEFARFGAMMEALLSKSHDLTIAKAEESLLLQLSAELTTSTTDEDVYWARVGEMNDLVSELVGVGPIDVYFRYGSQYVLKVSDGHVVQEKNATRIPVWRTLDLPLDDLREVEHLSLPPELSNSFQAHAGSLVYKCDFPNVNRRSLATILVIRGAGPGEASRDFILKFCRALALRSDLSGLLFEIMKDRRLFAQKVRRASHASKTPLQAALSDIEDLEDRGESASLADHSQALARTKRNISRASVEIDEILAGSTEPRKLVDLRSLVGSLIEEMKPLAQRQQCTTVCEAGPEPIQVEICEPEMRIALRNLLDNAIKYSFGQHEIRISLSIVRARTAKFVISNFGVGIPEDMLEAIREMGGRAGVADRKAEREGRTRMGSGAGLPIAIAVIEAHGGSLDIESYPPDLGPRSPYLRYVTRVTVTFPISREAT